MFAVGFLRPWDAVEFCVLCYQCTAVSNRCVVRRLLPQALSLFGDAALCNFPSDEQMEVEGVGADGNTVKVRRGA